MPYREEPPTTRSNRAPYREENLTNRSSRVPYQEEGPTTRSCRVPHAVRCIEAQDRPLDTIADAITRDRPLDTAPAAPLGANGWRQGFPDVIRGIRDVPHKGQNPPTRSRSEEHTDETPSLMRTSYAGLCLT